MRNDGPSGACLALLLGVPAGCGLWAVLCGIVAMLVLRLDGWRTLAVIAGAGLLGLALIVARQMVRRLRAEAAPSVAGREQS